MGSNCSIYRLLIEFDMYLQNLMLSYFNPILVTNFATHVMNHDGDVGTLRTDGGFEESVIIYLINSLFYYVLI